ncbi:hypothetical protein FOZ63_018148 [Perkinsus olseni]|uniref:Uncharacterized protein n=1 Tax=Perkinsus olseni TaxID=32597 RepID=A0A7J6ST46_PEROL|nr:hypothetical protein FOZ63_018148 [Perkinsus olseni]
MRIRSGNGAPLGVRSDGVSRLQPLVPEKCLKQTLASNPYRSFEVKHLLEELDLQKKCRALVQKNLVGLWEATATFERLMEASNEMELRTEIAIEGLAKLRQLSGDDEEELRERNGRIACILFEIQAHLILGEGPIETISDHRVGADSSGSVECHQCSADIAKNQHRVPSCEEQWDTSSSHSSGCPHMSSS